MAGSPTDPPFYIPSLRDPMKAVQDWVTEGTAEARGRPRIIRPGVVFDVGEDPPTETSKKRLRNLSPTVALRDLQLNMNTTIPLPLTGPPM